MRVSISITNFSWREDLRAALARVARAADRGGLHGLWVADHLLQADPYGARPGETEMLEAYTTLGFLAGVTERVRLGTMVTGVTFRPPALLVKAVTTLDVLSGGRAMFGVGAGYEGAEAAAMGLPLPPVAERFERLEETLRICLQMWAGDETPFRGTHYTLERPLNSPQPLQRPHPPILVGGGGEKKTLRLVARYAQACNFTPGSDVAHKLEVLRGHCQDVGRRYEEIEKTALYNFDPGPDGERVDRVLEELRALHDLGIEVAHGRVEGVPDIAPVELLAERVVPVVAGW
jgi:F420-dependent oxidoreductase-like protein